MPHRTTTIAALTSLTIGLSLPLANADTANVTLNPIVADTVQAIDDSTEPAGLNQWFRIMDLIVNELDNDEIGDEVNLDIEQLERTLKRWEGLAEQFTEQQYDPTASALLIVGEFLRLKKEMEQYELSHPSNTNHAMSRDDSKLSRYTLPAGLTLPPARNTSDPCRFNPGELPEQTLIFASGAYNGREISYQIDDSGQEATQFEVLVNQPGENVALWLGAYEPAIWNIAWTADTHIAGVAVSGYHRQVVAGLPDSTPLLQLSDYDCTNGYPSRESLSSINTQAKKLFADETDGFILPDGNGIILIGQPAAPDQYLTSPDTPPAQFYITDKPLAGEAGLHQLIAEGKIRAIKAADIRRWAEAKMAESNASIPPVFSSSEEAGAATDIDVWENYRPGSTHNGYMILEKINIPAGLYGAHSATFFLDSVVTRI